MADKDKDVTREDGPFADEPDVAYKIHVREDGKTVSTKFTHGGKEIEDKPAEDKPADKSAVKAAPVVSNVATHFPVKPDFGK